MNIIEVYKKIADDINLLIDTKVKNVSRDFTFKAQIVEPVDAGTYRILYKNAHYTARCSAALAPGDIVFVCAPANDWSELFINLLADSGGSGSTGYDDGPVRALIQTCFNDIKSIKNSVISKIRINGTETSISNNTADIRIPTNTSDLANDTGFITTSQLNESVGEKINRNGDTMSGALRITKPTWVSFNNGGDKMGQPGYLRLARIIVNQAYNNAPIELELLRRDESSYATVTIQYIDSPGTDPLIANFQYSGPADMELYIARADAGIWDLYLLKKLDWDHVTITNLKYSMEAYGHNFTIESPQDQIETLPASARKASLRQIPLEQLTAVESSSSQNRILHTCNGTPGEDGYVRFMGIEIMREYVDYQMQFTIMQRELEFPATVYLVFTAHTAEDIDNTSVQSLLYDGNNRSIIVAKESSRQFGVYVRKVHAWDIIDIAGLILPKHLQTALTITYSNTQVSGKPEGSEAACRIVNGYWSDQTHLSASAKSVKELNDRLTLLEQRLS